MFLTLTERLTEVGSPTSEEARLSATGPLSTFTFAPAGLEAVRLPELYKPNLTQKNEAVVNRFFFYTIGVYNLLFSTDN